MKPRSVVLTAFCSGESVREERRDDAISSQLSLELLGGNMEIQILDKAFAIKLQALQLWRPALLQQELLGAMRQGRVLRSL